MYLEALKLNVIEVSSAEDALEIIDSKEYKFSLILTDYEMSGMNGMDLTVALRCKYSKENLSIIAVSGADSSNIATSFLRYGANDFIKKPYTQEELTARINVNLDLINLFKKSKDDANKDFLTGLYNRRFLFDSGEKIVSKNRRKNKNVAVVMLDIDFFKKINDTYGHDVGDKAIKQIQVILHKKLRESDLVCRVGGEEFSSSDIEKKFEIVRKSFEDNIIEIGSISFSYTVSIGICYGMLNSLEDMITEADNALYTAKNSGRNKVILNII
jgi:diguanylate cyclase (GGDEF)-like protein